MSLLPISDVLNMIFGIIATVLAIFTIVIMLIARSTAATSTGDIDQGQVHRRLNILQAIIATIRFILNPESHATIRRHLDVISMVKRVYDTSVSKVTAAIEKGLQIPSRIFKSLLRRLLPSAGDTVAVVEQELDAMTV